MIVKLLCQVIHNLGDELSFLWYDCISPLAEKKQVKAVGMPQAPEMFIEKRNHIQCHFRDEWRVGLIGSQVGDHPRPSQILYLAEQNCGL
ncbi:MAG: hypothetical protein AUK03_06705 [Anaerolineae bacterium CG2_30_64_16]|nr:MAG: hypothetical protein AUK03_06705 [Anaerolineae bacterium CG2_30_64_16]